MWMEELGVNHFLQLRPGELRAATSGASPVLCKLHSIRTYTSSNSGLEICNCAGPTRPHECIRPFGRSCAARQSFSNQFARVHRVHLPRRGASLRATHVCSISQAQRATTRPLLTRRTLHRQIRMSRPPVPRTQPQVPTRKP